MTQLLRQQVALKAVRDAVNLHLRREERLLSTAARDLDELDVKTLLAVPAHGATLDEIAAVLDAGDGTDSNRLKERTRKRLSRLESATRSRYLTRDDTGRYVLTGEGQSVVHDVLLSFADLLIGGRDCFAWLATAGNGSSSNGGPRTHVRGKGNGSGR